MFHSILLLAYLYRFARCSNHLPTPTRTSFCSPSPANSQSTSCYRVNYYQPFKLEPYSYRNKIMSWYLSAQICLLRALIW
ncbi:hypothetical protein V8C26DRAFT_394292 [Trichoderma gracile]